MYLAHVVLSLRYSEIGRLFRRHRTTAAYACALVEERRDDPAVDRVLDTLEGLCGDLARGIRSRPQVRP
jgi:chromosomal replication initiation ATPase DnaA